MIQVGTKVGRSEKKYDYVFISKFFRLTCNVRSNFNRSLWINWSFIFLDKKTK